MSRVVVHVTLPDDLSMGHTTVVGTRSDTIKILTTRVIKKLNIQRMANLPRVDPELYELSFHGLKRAMPKEETLESMSFDLSARLELDLVSSRAVKEATEQDLKHRWQDALLAPVATKHNKRRYVTSAKNHLPEPLHTRATKSDIMWFD